LIIVFGYKPPQIGGDVGDLSRAIRAVGEQVTDEALTQVHAIDASVEVRVELVDDRPAEALLRAGEQYEALAVVVGATSHGPIRGKLLGSVTYEVVHQSTRPVVVVPEEPPAS
jgi:nucleotide-binding universal stress UspA family protein